MNLPNLLAPKRSIETVQSFGGLAKNARGASQFAYMENLSSDAYPLLSTRPLRGIIKTGDFEVSSSLYVGDYLCYTHDQYFIMDKNPAYSSDDTRTVVSMGLSGDPDTRLVGMGSYILIMPDKKYINTADTSDFGDIEFHASLTGAEISPCAFDGGEDSGGEYVKISSPSLGSGLSAGDGITVSGITADGLSQLCGNAVITAAGNGYIVIPGKIAGSKNSAVTLDRTMPEVDFMTESGNRMWGCRHGTGESGGTLNEIYASKLGDFKNWNVFQGLSTDSYAASVGTPGDFTGCTSFAGNPVFFKEDFIHRVFGCYPEQYQVQTSACSGVQSGCSDSIAAVRGVLYYKSRTGVCRYDGSAPVPVSGALGDTPYSSAAAGALGGKYYISMKDPSGKPSLFVFDTELGLWHREDGTAVRSFASLQGGLYFTAEGDPSAIFSACGGGNDSEKQFRWLAQTGIIGTEDPAGRYMSGVSFCMSASPGSRISISVRYDSQDRFDNIASFTPMTAASFNMPIALRRCSHFELRLEGVGSAKLYSLSYIYEKCEL